MKAIVRDRYGSPDVLRIDEVDRPTPGPGEVLVKVHAASVNTADLDLLKGLPRVARIGTGFRRPKTNRVGLDVAGRVEEVGPDVSRLRVGDGVWADLFSFGQGTFAEYVCAPEQAFTPKPETSFEMAATVPHSGVMAVQGLLARGPIRPGEKVLINGAGGCVGPFAVQVAKAFGAEVTGVDHTDKLDMLRSLGADHVIDYTAEDFTRNGKRYDLILDIAESHSVLRLRGSLGPGGRYVLVARTVSGFFRAAFVGLLVSLFASKRMGVFTWVPNRGEDLERLKGLIDRGKIAPLVDGVHSLEDVPRALRYLEEGRARGKLVVSLI